ncbi:MBL fold metallo-hydrolase [Sphaerisporangium aureirubrum]|uniref:MBL fold metallo-hydrolase n=1 Tax=Sphaerisporangium aureirubrum TaxID=1544736 RepID=A0ABW1NHI4_9ACTN
MAWEMLISTVDVRQGDCSLIIAENEQTSQRRSMLIDAGTQDFAETVHDYVDLRLPQGHTLDHMLVSTYSEEHYEGLLCMLWADNMHRVAEVIAEVATREAALGTSDKQQAACAAAGAYAACFGGYDMTGGQAGVTGWVANQAATIRAQADTRATLNAAIASGHTGVAANLNAAPPLNPVLTNLQRVAQAVAFAAGDDAWYTFDDEGFPNGNAPQATLDEVRKGIRDSVLTELLKEAPPGARFETGGAYATTNIIDNGTVGDNGPGPRQAAIAAARWMVDAAAGAVFIAGRPARAPGVARTVTRLTPPNLGAEILWNSGPHPVPAPAGAPGVFLVATEGNVWHTTQTFTGAVSVSQTDGLGMVVRFNDYFHYTGGDLPWAGSELVATAVTTYGLPNPQGGQPLPPATKIASFKCGVHGDDAGTSDAFLNTARPAVAFISSGKVIDPLQLSQSPSQKIVDRLHDNALIQRIYLTHCDYPRTYRPGGNAPRRPVPGGKATVCGDNSATDNTQHVRGHVFITISAIGATAPVAFVVTYKASDGSAIFDRIYVP